MVEGRKEFYVWYDFKIDSKVVFDKVMGRKLNEFKILMLSLLILNI